MTLQEKNTLAQPDLTHCPSSSTLARDACGRLETERARALEYRVNDSVHVHDVQCHYGKRIMACVCEHTLNVLQNKLSQIVAEEAFPGLRPMGNETGVTRRPRR